MSARSRLAILVSLACIGVGACSALTPTTAAPVVSTAEPTTAPPPPATATRLPTAAVLPTAEPTANLDWIGQAGPSEVDYELPLFARHVSETKAWLQFEAKEGIVGRLLVWPVDRSQQPTVIEVNSPGGVFEVAGLAPGTTYRAAIVIGEEPQQAQRPTLAGSIWPAVEFTTQGGAEPLTAVVLGDSGFGDAVTAALVRQIEQRDPDFTLHTGDLVYRAEENVDPPAAFLAKLYEPLAPLFQRGPFYPVPGNHEFDFGARWQGEAYYWHAFPAFSGAGLYEENPGWYAFRRGDAQFIMLHSQVLFGQPGAEAQTEWLQERLQDESYRYSIVVLHVPAYTVGRHQSDAVVVRSRWAALFESAQVPLVLAGHDHNYQRFLVDDTTYVISGGGSAVTYPLRDSDARLRASSAQPHFVLLTIEQERLVLEVVNESGISLDRYEVALPPVGD